MSGIEPVALVGLICDVIAIVCKIKQVYEAANDAFGVDSELKEVIESLPLVLSTLRSVERIQEQNVQRYMVSSSVADKQSIAEATHDVQPILASCKRNAQALQVLLAKRIPLEGQSSAQRFRQQMKSTLSGSRGRIQALHGSLMSAIDTLRTNQFFTMASSADGSNSETTAGTFQTLATMDPIELPLQPDLRAFHWHNDGMNKIGSQGSLVIHGGQTVNM